MFKIRSTFSRNMTVFSAWRNFYLNLIAGAFYDDHETHSCYCGNYLCKIKTERASCSETKKRAAAADGRPVPQTLGEASGQWHRSHIMTCQ